MRGFVLRLAGSGYVPVLDAFGDAVGACRCHRPAMVVIGAATTRTARDSTTVRLRDPLGFLEH
jgi:hypothetical protein